MRVRVIPSLLLKNQGLVKTIKFKNPTYVGDPINAVKIFNEKECDELMILDITASLDKKEPQFALVEDIATEAFMPFAYGGGITHLDHIKRLLSCGAEKVVLNSVLFENLKLVEDAASIFGAQAVVASVDVKKNLWGKYEVHSHSGTKNQKKDPTAWAQQLEAAGVGEILLNSIDLDGTQTGYNLELIQKVASAVNIPVVALGGAGNLNHFRQAVHEGKASAVAAGSLFIFHGKHRAVLISYPSSAEIEGISG
jgi:cyclase